MTLCTVTFWTTLLLLLVTIAVPYVYLFDKDAFSMDFSTTLASIMTVTDFILVAFVLVLCCSILWLLTGSPLLVSLLIARKLKYAFPAFILLVSTIVYGLWFGFIFHQQFADSSEFLLPYIVIGSIIFMLPTWCLSWRINACFVDRYQSNPRTARCSVPGSF